MKQVLKIKISKSLDDFLENVVERTMYEKYSDLPIKERDRQMADELERSEMRDHFIAEIEDNQGIILIR